jgi:RES domain-containing protein
MRRHAESERLARALARCEKHAGPWAGVVYRSASVRYANRDDLLTGAGSKSTGARWNPPDSAATVYTSLDIQTAVAEALAHHRYYGFAVERALPRVLVSIQVRLQRVLQLTDRKVSRVLGVTRGRLLGEDWRACNRGGEEALTQAIGRLAWDAGWEGLAVPSAADPSGAYLIVFPGNLLPPRSYLLIFNRDQLPSRPQ